MEIVVSSDQKLSVNPKSPHVEAFVQRAYHNDNIVTAYVQTAC